jgi:hypothetical protein
MPMLIERPGRASDRQLRQFAIALIVFALVAIALRWARHGSVGLWAIAAACAAVAVGIAGAIAPRRIASVFWLVTTLTLPIGMVVSELMLAVLYFVVITPMALLFRIAGRDRLRRSIDRDAPTYWVAHRDAPDAARYFRQS